MSAAAATAPANHPRPSADVAVQNALSALSTLPDHILSTILSAVNTSVKSDGKVDKVAFGKLVDVIGEQSASAVSRDSVLAHTFLLVTFHHKLLDGNSEINDLAVLCAAELRYDAYMKALVTAVAKDASFIKNVPLPPVDVAMFWHAHMLSPIRYADDVHRFYSPDLMQISFPLMRLVKVQMGQNSDDLAFSRQFWAEHLPADMPYDLTLADVDQTKAVGKVVCPQCMVEQMWPMADYAAFRLHGQEQSCKSCTASFTAEHVAVSRFLTLVMRVPAMRLAGTLMHPKTLMITGTHRGIMHDLVELFDKDLWALHMAALPTLPTWADVKTRVFAPIMAAKADALVMPENKAQLMQVLKAHEDVTMGPWSMDMIRAVRRQSRFSAKVAAIATQGACALHHFHTEALVQYPKFLGAIATQPKHGSVPTLAIDLAWHTHQLHPAIYAQQTCALTGRVINHDDSDDKVSEAQVAEGAQAMPGM
ncbi:hypothetical protein GGF31_008511 [Allomyces arbusculus]|nr:hypothetical protein GGF31_008511 [Allomyces arbusculus]